MAVCVRPRRIDLAHVRRSGAGRPRVLAAASFQREGEDAAVLERLRRTHQLGRHRCATLLEAGEYQMLQIDAPAVAAAELKQALRWRLKDVLETPVDAMAIDAVLVPNNGAAAGRPQQALAIAAPKADVARRAAAFAAAKIELAVIDVPELAQRNVAALFEEPNRGLALLCLDDGGGLLTLTGGGELFASRHIDIDVAQLVDAGPDRRDQLFDRLLLELQRSLDNFDRQFSFVNLSRLLIASATRATWVIERLGQNLFLPVAPLDLGEALDLEAVPELAERSHQAHYLPAIGVALREAQPG